MCCDVRVSVSKASTSSPCSMRSSRSTDIHSRELRPCPRKTRPTLVTGTPPIGIASRFEINVRKRAIALERNELGSLKSYPSINRWYSRTALDSGPSMLRRTPSGDLQKLTLVGWSLSALLAMTCNILTPGVSVDLAMVYRSLGEVRLTGVSRHSRVAGAHQGRAQPSLDHLLLFSQRRALPLHPAGDVPSTEHPVVLRQPNRTQRQAAFPISGLRQSDSQAQEERTASLEPAGGAAT